MAKKKTLFTKKMEGITERITVWLGTPISLIVHTVIFLLFTIILAMGFDFNKVLLVWNTSVSLEAIYLALFIQMTVNRNTESLEDVTEDIDEIQEDVEGLEEDVDKIQEDVEGVEEDIDRIQQEEEEEESQEQKDTKTFKLIENQLTKLTTDMTVLRKEIESLRHHSTK